MALGYTHMHACIVHRQLSGAVRSFVVKVGHAGCMLEAIFPQVSSSGCMRQVVDAQVTLRASVQKLQLACRPSLTPRVALHISRCMARGCFRRLADSHANDIEDTSNMAMNARCFPGCFLGRILTVNKSLHQAHCLGHERVCLYMTTTDFENLGE